MANAQAPASRLHIVLVPGFGGFDALGQVEYYAGTTSAFRAWRDAQPAAPRPAVLHYFDNLPTAGVRTRARLLREYLTKRLLRGELQPGDEIALVGHSTGGLDIRQLILDLDEQAQQKLAVAGGEDHDARAAGAPVVRGDDLLGMITRVVFISVPNRGTNIANWVRAQPLFRHVIVALARTAVDALDVPVIEPATVIAARLVSWVRESQAGARLGKIASDFVVALTDVNTEIGLRNSTDPWKAASGRAALADLNAWLSHTHGDFLAINDLSSTEHDPSVWGSIANVVGKVTRPLARASAEEDDSKLARASEAERARERAVWGERIRVRSYATVARNPFPKETSNRAQLRSITGVLRRALRRDPGSDLTFRAFYAACAAGPFQHAMRENSATDFFRNDGDRRRVLEAYENDGVVNTASMLWPSGDATLLVDADHGDIIGHYARKPALDASFGRKYDAYDFFHSSSGLGGHVFGEDAFIRVWNDIFSFCAS